MTQRFKVGDKVIYRLNPEKTGEVRAVRDQGFFRNYPQVIIDYKTHNLRHHMDDPDISRLSPLLLALLKIPE